MRAYDFILFDADNTLFDFDSAEHLALRKVLEDRGLPYNAEIEERYLAFNRPLWQANDRGEVTFEFLTVERFRLLLDSLDASHLDPAQMNEDFLTALGTYSTLLPEAEDTCRALSAAGHTLAVITNGLVKVQQVRFARCPITHLFRHIFVSQAMGCQKPQPAFFDAVCTALGVTDHRRVLVVGDSLSSDIQGAVNSGLDSVWFSPKGGDSPLPTHTIRRLSRLKELLIDQRGSHI